MRTQNHREAKATREANKTCMAAKAAILSCALVAALSAALLAGCSPQAGGTSGSAASASASAAAASASAPMGDVEYVLYLGTNDKDTNQPVYSREESKERAKKILMENFGGYTIQEAEGGWKSDDGKEYQEYTLVIYLSDTDLDAVHATARELIAEFHQKSVLINTELVQTEFYEGE